MSRPKTLFFGYFVDDAAEDVVNIAIEFGLPAEVAGLPNNGSEVDLWQDDEVVG
jgi:hypothetical protein